MFLYTVYIYLKNNIIINKTLHMFRVYILPARYILYGLHSYKQ